MRTAAVAQQRVCAGVCVGGSDRITPFAFAHAVRAISAGGPAGDGGASSSGGGVGGGVASSSSSNMRTAVEQMYSASQTRRDPFLREGTATSRFFRAYRTRLPFAGRMAGIFFLGFFLGLVIEVFACKTHLYESVMMKKDARRHEFDEFVVDFRQNVERWQRQDMSKRQAS
jgi:hypothetical protein